MNKPNKYKITKDEIIEIDSSDSSSELKNDNDSIPESSKKKITKNITASTTKRKKTVKSETVDETSKKKPNSKKRKNELLSNSDIKLDSEDKVPKKRRKKTEELQCDTNNKLNFKLMSIDSEIDPTDQMNMDWTEIQYICEMHNVNESVASNVVKLYEQENTVSFIARYRKNMTGGMEADNLRAIKDSYERAKTIKQRAAVILKSIDKLGKWTPNIHALIKSAKSLNTLEYINSLFKVPGKRSLSEKAKQLGLGDISDRILKGQSICLLSSFINPSKDGLKNEKEIKDGIIHILADVISKEKALFDKIQVLRKNTIAYIQVSKRKVTKESKNVDVKTEFKPKKETDEKYKNYFDFKSRSDNIKPHQILAINRGENHKILTVKVSIPFKFEESLRYEFQKIYKNSLRTSQTHNNLLMESFEYAYKKSIEPALIRRIRSELNEQAEMASIEVFATNLKQLLLAPPFRGKTILGIDPGFSHGCKLAVISETGSVLATNVIYLQQTMKKYKVKSENTKTILVNLVQENNCSTIALGNGTACRETELLLTDLITSGAFKPMDVSYTIVNECGASIYSCSEEAKQEFPNIDYNLISAISIARRLQDPLAELVKIEPKHLGVGMYQHDLPEKQLDATLNEVVIETVSFVGVDINTASLCLLKKIAGLTLSRAKAILDWRKKNGCFINRKQLLDVKGIGQKSFEQCAGFIRILPETFMLSNKSCTTSINNLDQTWIHPESYDIAYKIVKDAGCNLNDFKTDEFINMINNYARCGNEVIAKKFKTEIATVEIIIKGLTTKKDFDIRLTSDKPLFRKNVKGIEDLDVGITLRGEVRNVTHFGVFVDIGVTRNGLIPLKFMKGRSLGVGQRVEVKILSIEKERNRISLELIDLQ